MDKRKNFIKSMSTMNEKINAIIDYLKSKKLKAYPLELKMGSFGETLLVGIADDEDTSYVSDLEFISGYFINLKMLPSLEVEKLIRDREIVSLVDSTDKDSQKEQLEEKQVNDVFHRIRGEKDEEEEFFFRIKVTKGVDEGTSIIINERGVSIGRYSRNSIIDLVLSDNSISKRHADLMIDTFGRPVINDLESTNGTFVNGELITHKVLQAGDVIKIGQTEMTIEKINASSVHPDEKKNFNETISLAKRKKKKKG
ncbi:MAG: FHA domain-containing protein [Pseudomonadota bacterium]